MSDRYRMAIGSLSTLLAGVLALCKLKSLDALNQLPVTDIMTTSGNISSQNQQDGVFEAHDPAMFADRQPLYAPMGSTICNPAEPVTCQSCGHTQQVEWKHALRMYDGVLASQWTRPEPMPSCKRCGAGIS